MRQNPAARMRGLPSATVHARPIGAMYTSYGPNQAGLGSRPEQWSFWRARALLSSSGK